MKDIRAFLLWWAAERRLRLDRPTIIAITGSIAKTSTKVAIGAVLEAAFPNQVRAGFGNLNTYLGVPLAILGCRLDFHHQRITWQWPVILGQALYRSMVDRLPRFLVVEISADRPGDIAQLTQHIRPDIAILTITGPAHLQNYPSLAAIAQEKGNLIAALKPDGLAILNRQDPFLSAHQQRFGGSTLVFDCPVEEIAVTVARAVGRHFGVRPKVINQALAHLVRPTGRLVERQIGAWRVIDDSYNANPLSMEAALRVLSRMTNRRVAVLGSMLELGPQEVPYHQQIGRLARQQAELVIGVGELARHYLPDIWFADAQQAATRILAYLKEGDSILIKGSRGIQMEQIIQRLTDASNRR